MPLRPLTLVMLGTGVRTAESAEVEASRSEEVVAVAVAAIATGANSASDFAFVAPQVGLAMLMGSIFLVTECKVRISLAAAVASQLKRFSTVIMATASTMYKAIQEAKAVTWSATSKGEYWDTPGKEPASTWSAT